MTDIKTSKGGATRYVVAVVLVMGAFFGAYAIAQGKSGSANTGGSDSGSSAVIADTADAGAACSCCGSTAPTENGVTGEIAEGVAVVTDGVQKIDVDVSTGIYQPNVIKLKAGVPAEITFANGSGCTGQVVSEALGFSEDLTSGPRNVKLPALEPGEYSFYCGMQMVFGKIVVE